MIRIVFGIFIVLHGLVHMLYFGQSTSLFELQPGIVWPDGAWAFSRLLGTAATRSLAGVLLILSAVGFVSGGIAIFMGQPWWRQAVIGAAIVSALIWILFWDGIVQGLSEKGIIALAIDLSIMVVLLVLRWSPVK